MYAAFTAAAVLLVHASAAIQYVIVISIDGGRGDFIQTFIETAPTEFRTLSGCGTDQRSRLTRGAITRNMGKTRLQICERSWDAVNGAPDTIGADNGRDKIDVATILEASGTTATTTMLASFVATIQSTTLKNFTFFHIADTDYAGHSGTWSMAVGSNYRNVMKVADGWLGQILDAVQGNGALADKVAFVLTADHGGGTPANNHTDATNVTNYTIPFFFAAPGVAGGSNIYDYFENRRDAGSARPTYTNSRQPMRNGDVANLSAALLGLPSVPGSLMTPELVKPVALVRAGNTITVSWPIYLTGYTLEYTDNLTAPSWTAITSGIVEANGQNGHSFTFPPPDARFFRLRKPSDSSPVLSPAQNASTTAAGKAASKSDNTTRKGTPSK